MCGPGMPALALGVLAGVALHFGMAQQRSLIDEAVDAALDGEDLPANAMQAAHALPFVLIPIVGFVIVFSLVSLVCTAAGCVTGAEAAVVPMGIPVYTSASYSSMAPAMPFSDGLCACTNDPKLCITTCIVPAAPIAQLWERVMLPRGSRIHFWPIFGVLVLCGLIAASVTGCPEPTVECYSSGEGAVPHCELTKARVTPTVLCSLASSVQVIGGLLSVALLVVVRSAVRKHYGIAPTCCGECDDVCCACWCWPLATCQVMRTLNAVEASQYKLLSTNGVGAV